MNPFCVMDTGPRERLMGNPIPAHSDLDFCRMARAT
jgi:hypothetical protein